MTNPSTSQTIGIHSQKDGRYICHLCGQTFTARKGTAFYRLRKDRDVIVTVITLLAHGCPIQSIVVAFGLDERTVLSWQKRAGECCEGVPEQLVAQLRDLGQVQADEMRVKKQGGVVWLAMALPVSTRLWLGGVLSAHGDGELITALAQKVNACALCRPLLFCSDGFTAYVGAIQDVFRAPVPTGKAGRPYLRPRGAGAPAPMHALLRPWDGLYMAQVIKRHARKRVVDIERRLVQGTMPQVESLLRQTQGVTGQINVAFIERFNTARSRISALVRRGRALARQSESLHPALYLIGTVYNFCTYHKSLRLPIYLPGNRRRWVGRTPAMAAPACRQAGAAPITSGPWRSCSVSRYRYRPGHRPNVEGGLPTPPKRSLRRWCS